MPKCHPLQTFWDGSGWYSSHTPLPELGLSEGNLCIDTWNAAIKAALDCVVQDGNPMVAREKIAKLYYNGATY